MSIEDTLDAFAKKVAKEAVRKILQAHLQKGAAMGAGAGEAVYQGSGE